MTHLAPNGRPLAGDENLAIAGTRYGAQYAPPMDMIKASSIAAEVGLLGRQIDGLVRINSTVANLEQAAVIIARLRAEIEKLEAVL